MKQRKPENVILSILAALLLLFPGGKLLAQEEVSSPCAVNLQNAQAAFDRGQVEQVPGLLEECLKSGFTKEEQLTAYKLIIQTLLFEDKLAQADSAMLAFLKKNPEYELSPTDHSSFVTLFNTFRVKPIIQLSVHIGTNIPYITFIDPNTTSPEIPNRKYSTTLINFYGGVEAKMKISERLDLSIEPGISQVKFKNREIFTDNLISGITDYTEKQMRVELPVSVTYNLKALGKFTPYFRAGGGAALALSVKATGVENPSDLNNLVDRSGNEYDRSDSRIKTDAFALVGTGIKFKTKGGYLFGEVRSDIGLFNQIVKGGDSQMEQGFFYFYTDDKAFHLNTLNINFGYTQIFYKPSKRRE